MDDSDSNSSSNISLESIHLVLTSVATQIATMQEQMDRLSAKVGLDTDMAASKLSAKDAARQQEIIARGDAKAAYEFTKDVPGADIQSLQQVVLERGSGWVAYNFARDIPGADIQALQQVVINLGDGIDAYWFAKKINGADIQALRQVVLERGDGCDAYFFARDIPGADIDALQRVGIERGDGWALYSFALDVAGADLVALHSRLVELKSTGYDNGYLERFNTSTDIQARLKIQLDADRSKKHRPS